jgi:hypothetical protein
MALHWPFGYLEPKLWAKEGPGVKLAIWLPTTKSRESPCSRRALRECDIALKSSLWGLQLWFRPCPNRRSGWGAMKSQILGTPTGIVSGQLRDSISGVPGKSDIQAWVPWGVTEYTIGSKVVAYSRVRAVVCLVVRSAYGLSQHPRVSRMLN